MRFCRLFSLASLALPLMISAAVAALPQKADASLVYKVSGSSYLSNYSPIFGYSSQQNILDIDLGSFAGNGTYTFQFYTNNNNVGRGTIYGYSSFQWFEYDENGTIINGDGPFTQNPLNFTWGGDTFTMQDGPQLFYYPDGNLWQVVNYWSGLEFLEAYSSVPTSQPINYTLAIWYGPAPEPATWAMLISGVAMIGFAARRRREGMALAA